MKKTLLSGCIALFALSCSTSNDTPFDNSDPANQKVILPTKMSKGGIVMKVNYNGTKIISLINAGNTGQRTEFTYTDDYITGIKNYENNILENAFEYAYSNGRMSSAVNKEYTTNGTVGKTITYTYTYTSNTEISVKKQANLGANNNYTLNSIYTYSNGNMVKSAGTGTGTSNGATVNYTESGTYTHTDKNYAFKNVKGLDKVIFNGDEPVTTLFSNIKNSLSTYKGQLNSTGAGTVSVAYKYTTTFNESGYPAIESRQPVDNAGNPTSSSPEKFIYEYNYQ
ncbi:hypothetical protein F3J23_10460 [Chryseobacterium sp. Tr-659]|uniref:hypothetical protein n=1 Tax=Chryseobacterium sp. Tr-659 TaxID=2608340 RepID=UPI00141EDE23|nr:hypothetical protein [Chryseobacterium sp. Tr-659]NIF05867.1 hypothetical protein [Chryseobacterium sp. Tr-659]